MGANDARKRSRREFLKLAGAAAAGVVMAGRPFAVAGRASRFCGRRPSSVLRKAPQAAQKSEPCGARVLQTGQSPRLGAAGISSE